MSKLTDDLFTLQTLLRLGANTSAAQRQQVEDLKAAIPLAMTPHFLRQIASDRRGIACVRNGVCGECHLRLPHAMVYMLGRSNEVLVCESCGSFVTLAPEARVAAAAVRPKAARVVQELEAVAG